MTTTDTSVTNNVSHTSYSAISDLVHCPKAYQLGRVLNLEQAPGYALAGGSAVHAATEAYDRIVHAETGN